MHHSLRKIAALGLWGCILMGVGVHGCSNRLGPVRATQNAGGPDRPNLPDVLVEHAKVCVEIDGHQLEPGRVDLEATIPVHEDGDKLAVTLMGIPETAFDFGACMRNALRDMPIAAQPFQQAVAILKYRREHASDGKDELFGFLEAIPGVPMVDGEVVLEVEGYTVALRVRTKVVPNQKKLFDLDKQTLARIGQMALGSLGYEEIMRRAEELGWVKKVPIKQARSAAAKGLMGDGPLPPNVEQIVRESFKMVMTKAAPVALVASQVDSPAPGPGDLVAIGIFGVALVATGAVSVYIYVSNKNAEGSTASVGAPAPQPQPPPPPPPPAPPPPPPPPRETCEANSEMKKIIRCDDPKISHYQDGSENKAYSTIVSSKGKGLSKEKSKKDAEGGPCEGRGGWHTNVVRGRDYIASIMGCNCCDDSNGKAIQKEKSRIRYH